MTRVIIDEALRKKLHNLTETLQLCDEKGRVLAVVMPQYDPALDGPLEPRVSEEELDRREKSNEKTYTTAEVIAYLESL